MDGTEAPGPVNPALGRLSAAAVEDLAARLKISPEEIELIEARAVVWPDGSLGCPQPDMLYPQVQVDGALFRLRVGKTVYEYHSGGSRPPFLCENPAG